jgi:hypothetical protein
MDEKTLSLQLEQIFKAKTSMRPNRIEFHTLKSMSTLQGVGKQLKEQRLIDNRPKAGATAS